MKYFIFLLLLCKSFFTKGQEFHVVLFDGSIGLVDITTCKNTILSKPNEIFGDISFSNDGKLYGVSSLGIIYEINPNSGALTKLTVIDKSTTSELFNAMVSDINGIIYIVSGSGNLYTFDPITKQNLLLGNIPFGSAGDLIFHKGQLYLAAYGNQLIEVNISKPSASTVFMNFNVTSPIFGIVTLSPDCDNSKSYAISANKQVLEIDFINKKLNFVCKIEGSNEIFGAASKDEFNASAAIDIAGVKFSNPECGKNNGIIDVMASSGAGGVRFSIDGKNFQPSGKFENLKKGNYTVQIKGPRDCMSDTIILLKSPGEPLIISKVIPNGCDNINKGLIEVVAEPTDSSTISYSIDNQQFTSEGRYENLTSGNYTVFLKTSKGCNIELPFSIESLPKPIFLDLKKTNTTCGNQNGTVTILTNNSSINGHKYSLDNIVFSTKNSISGLPSGDYTIFVKDSSGCSSYQKLNIEGSESLKIKALDVISTTCGTKNGRIKIDAEWSNGNKNNIFFQLDNSGKSSKNTFQDLIPKTYSLTVGNSINNCGDTAKVIIKDSNPLILEKITTIDSKCSENKGQISVVAKGNGALSYQLENTGSQSNNIFTELQKGIYNITIRDTQSCSLTIPNILISPDCFVYFPNIFSPDDNGTNDYFTIFADDKIVKKISYLHIFNRWGGLVFEAKDFPTNAPEFGWNGKYNGIFLKSDVFTFVAQIEYFNGKIATLSGDITLLR